MKSKKKLVKEYIQKIISKLCCEYGTSLEDARKAVEELDLLNRYKGNYDFVLYQNVSTWVNLIVNKHKANKHKKEVEKEDAERENLENKTTANHILVYTEQPTTKNTKAGDVVLYENEVWLNRGNVFTAIPLRDLDGYIDKDGTILKLPNKNYVDEKVEETLKEFIPNRMDVQIYNKVFLPQWTTASLFIRNLQRTLEDKCDKESLRQLQIIGWNEETKKFISDVLNLYKENVLNELRDNVSNKPEKKEENTMENYIVINGKKAELTEEQLKQLGIEVEEKRNSPFDRVSGSESYYFISAEDNIDITSEAYIEVDQLYFDNANYFNDTDFANQVMLHQQLYRKLLKYAWDNEAEDLEWDEDGVNPHYYIYFDNTKGHFVVEEHHYCHSQNIYFSSEKVAKQAIEYIIKPFMKEHPEFVW